MSAPGDSDLDGYILGGFMCSVSYIYTPLFCQCIQGICQLQKNNPKQINSTEGKMLKEQYSLGLGRINIGGNNMSSLGDLFFKTLPFFPQFCIVLSVMAFLKQS